MLESLKKLMEMWANEMIDQIKIIGRMLRYLDMHHETIEKHGFHISRLETRIKRLEKRLDALEA